MLSGSDCRDGTTEHVFADELSRLKRQGASVLVAGVSRADQRETLSRRLLGTSVGDSRKRVIVSTPGADFDIKRLVADADPKCVEVIRYQGTARGATAQPSAQPTSSAPSTSAASPQTPSPPAVDLSVTSADTLTDIGIGVSSAIERFERDGDLEPGALRVGVDSLVPFLEEYGRETVFQYLHLLSGRTRDVGGIAHYQLPIERDSSVVSVLSPLFDVIVELRERNGVAQERWSLTDSDLSSGWLPMNQ